MGFVCVRYVDTDTLQESCEGERALRLAGFGSIRLAVMRVFSIGALILNLILWDWCYLGLADALMGWSLCLGAIAGTFFIASVLKSSAHAFILFLKFGGAAGALFGAAFLRIRFERRRDEARVAENN